MNLKQKLNLLSLLAIFSLLFSSTLALAQGQQPPQQKFPSIIPHYPPMSGLEKWGDTGIEIVPTLSRGIKSGDIQAAVPLGQPGLSYRYVQTFGETEVPYLADTAHLNRPVGLFLDSGNNIYITEDAGSRVLKYNSAGHNLLALGQAGLCITDYYIFCTPKDVTLDGSGNLWVADGNRVVEYDSGGIFIQQLPDTDPWASGNDNFHFNWVNGIVFDSVGHMFISDTNNHRVQVYTFNAGVPVYNATIGVTDESGSDSNHFNSPYRLSVDSNDRLYVVDQNNNRVQQCTFSGGWNCTTFSAGLNGPQGITIDGSDNAYIADTFNGRILKCTSGGVCTDFVTGTYGFYDLAVDSSGNVYGAAAYEGIVVKYNSGGGLTGTFLGTEFVPYLTDSYHYFFPRVAIDNFNNIIILEESGHRLTKLNASGTLQWSVGAPGVDIFDNSHLNYPHGVATDANGNIYVADNNRVQIFGANGTYLNTIGGSWGSGNYQFQWATGIAVDRNNGNIYVADGPNQRVQVYNSSRVYIATIGENGVSGSDNNHFNYPIGVEVDTYGNIYIADIGNCRVQKFNGSRVYQMTFGSTGSCTNSFADVSAEDVTVDANGRVYVAGWDNRVQVFDSNGAYLTTIGGAWGNLSSQFRGASGVAVDSKGNVYVSDATNARIQKFAPGVPLWDQVNINGFGNRYNDLLPSMEVFNGYLYVGAANYTDGTFHLWRTVDGQTWQETGYDFQAGVSALASFNNKLYAATWLGRIYSSSDGLNWANVYTGPTTQGFASFSQFGNTLYAGTYTDPSVEGTKILKTTDGTNWTPFVTNGNGDQDASGAISGATFNGSHYFGIGDWSGNQGGRLWRYNGTNLTTVVNDGFGNPDNYAPGGIVDFNGKIYVSIANPNTFQVWTSTSGDMGTWSKAFEGGQGQLGAKDRTGLVVFNSQLYLVAQNDHSGLQVWRTANGASWEQIGYGGFGDSNNSHVEWSSGLEVFNNKLYISANNFANGGEIWSLLNTFTDVSSSYWAWSYIERLANAGITGGCGTGIYCPEDSVTRAQMAVFLERGVHYPTAFTAPDVAPTFNDTVGHWAEDWIEALKNDGITAGCGSGNYCPEAPVTRAQMAIFLLRAKHGPNYTPPNATGIFTDVPLGYWAADWIEQLAAEGITGGCGTGVYCPDASVTRAQMAVFLVKTFNLP